MTVAGHGYAARSYVCGVKSAAFYPLLVRGCSIRPAQGASLPASKVIANFLWRRLLLFNRPRRGRIPRACPWMNE